MDAFRDSSFQLIENPDGHAIGDTVMTFADSASPWIASYNGPNIVIGQVMLHDQIMHYQALDTSGEFCAGRAKVSYLVANGNSPAQMILNWQWLTGDRSKGVSRWRKLDSV